VIAKKMRRRTALVLAILLVTELSKLQYTVVVGTERERTALVSTGSFDGITKVPTSLTLSVNVSELNLDTISVHFYQVARAFKVIVLPDTQKYCWSPSDIFENQTQWTVDNVKNENIVFVTHEGDLVDVDIEPQWLTANRCMSKLDDTVAWGVCPGNHDAHIIGGTNFTNYNIYFGCSRFEGKSWYGEGYSGSNSNSYQFFSSGEDDYLIFHFQYNPSEDILSWANNTIESYPERRVIVTTHEYLESNGKRTKIGETIWQKFVKPHADQIFLVLCGHVSAEAQRINSINDHAVYQLLADYQERTNGGDGWLRVLEFLPAEDKIQVKTFSPYLNKYETDVNSEFTLDYNMTSSSLIGTANNIPNNRMASVEWTGLDYSTTYQWYAVATDSHGSETKSNIYSFTTLAEASTIKTCDSTGNEKTNFHSGDQIFIKGTSYTPSTTYDLYVVNHQDDWKNEDPIPQRISNTTTTVQSDSNGNIPPTIAWESPQTIGKYDIIIDVYKNGRYDPEVDALNNNEILPQPSINSAQTIIIIIVIGASISTATVFSIQKRQKRLKHPRRQPSTHAILGAPMIGENTNVCCRSLGPRLLNR
jgi:hypothetical protein